MKMKKSLLSVVFLLATSSAMAAMSYSSASVTSDMSVSMVGTDQALLALKESTTHNASFYNSVSANRLELNLNKGLDNVEYGVQANSVYKWDDLFEVKNNSEHDVNVTIKLNPNVNGENVNIYASTDYASWTRISSIIPRTPGGALTFVLKAGKSQFIDMKTDANNGHEENFENLDLIVEAEKVATAGTPD